MTYEKFLVLGIIGDRRVGRSLSPRMHNTVMQRRGLRGVYAPFPVESGRMAQAVAGIRGLGIDGVNVTVPHKEEAARQVDNLSEAARRIGAVNTIVRSGRVLEGHNTDADGFNDALAQAGFEADGLTVLVVGAGGAARAVLFALRRLGAQVRLAGRNRVKIKTLADEMEVGAVTWEEWPEAAARVDLLINASSVSAPDEAPNLAATVARIRLDRPRLVFDLNYGREENFWRDLAGRHGAVFMDGLIMLAYQARRSFALWTGIEATFEEFYQPLAGG